MAYDMTVDALITIIIKEQHKSYINEKASFSIYPLKCMYNGLNNDEYFLWSHQRVLTSKLALSSTTSPGRNNLYR